MSYFIVFACGFGIGMFVAGAAALGIVMKIRRDEPVQP